MTERLSLIDRRFGKLVVISCIEESNAANKYKGKWLCKCDCGTEKIIKGPALTTTTEPTRSCGCLRKSTKNLIGKRYGKLLVIKCILTYDQDKNSRGVFLCQCDCGRTVEAKGKMLGWKEGGRRSCGCLTSICKRVDEDRTYRESYRGHTKHADEKGFKPLSYDVWGKLVVQDCYYCGEKDIKISRELLNKRFATESDIENSKKFINGVDRVDNNIGYEIENCVPCCAQCNRMKLNYPKEYFYKRIETIYNHHINPYLSVGTGSFLCN